jgi:hypothetical protein
MWIAIYTSSNYHRDSQFLAVEDACKSVDSFRKYFEKNNEKIKYNSRPIYP